MANQSFIFTLNQKYHGINCTHKYDFPYDIILWLVFKIHFSWCWIYDALYSHFSLVECCLHSSLAQSMRIFEFENIQFFYFEYCMSKEYAISRNRILASVPCLRTSDGDRSLWYVACIVGSRVIMIKTHTFLVQYSFWIKQFNFNGKFIVCFVACKCIVIFLRYSNRQMYYGLLDGKWLRELNIYTE